MMLQYAWSSWKNPSNAICGRTWKQERVLWQKSKAAKIVKTFSERYLWKANRDFGPKTWFRSTSLKNNLVSTNQKNSCAKYFFAKRSNLKIRKLFILLIWGQLWWLASTYVKVKASMTRVWKRKMWWLEMIWTLMSKCARFCKKWFPNVVVC